VTGRSIIRIVSIGFDDLAFFANGTNAVNGFPSSATIFDQTFKFTVVDGVCFASGTPITTDQGDVAIQEIDPKVNTINGNRIVGITKTRHIHNVVVCIEKGALDINVPSKDTIVTGAHMVLYNDKMETAEILSKQLDKVYKVKYNDYVYNVLMDSYEMIKVNNMVCETLHPNNPIAKMYRKNNNID